MLGRFDHVVDFPGDWEFVIIHGPNGVGKTKLLELMSYTFNFEIRELANIPFESARFDFSDGSKLTITRVQAEIPRHRPNRQQPRSRLGHVIQFNLERPKRAPISYTAGNTHPRQAELVEVITALLPVRRVGPDTFRDMRDNTILSLAEVLEAYGDQLPRELYPEAEGSTELREFFSDINVYLIETQRLLNIPLEPLPRARYAQEPEPPKSRVQMYSADLAQRLKDALAQNSRRSQELDRTFPGRLLQERPPLHVTDEQIRDRYNLQDEHRARLAQIDVLGAAHEYLPLPDRDLVDWERHVLWTYLDDTERKLDTFKDLLARLQLLQEVVNSRFRYKTLKISGEQGFVIVTDSGEEIPPNRLSSGEQHELVLIYGLLFKVEENTLVLIDEPEISLHVGWQRKFLADLFDISKLTSLRFLIATHSPQIIHKWWERTVSLVPHDEMDD